MAVLAYSVLGYMFLKRTSKAWEIANICLSIIDVLGVLYVTVFNREYGKPEIELMPLYSLFDQSIDVEKYRVSLMNVFLFFPLGISMPFALQNKSKHPLLLAVCFNFLLSLVIESIQYAFGLGKCEVDDIIMNTIGALIGTFAFISSNMATKNIKRNSE